MSALRLGAVPYLNAAPLLEGLSGDPQVALELAVPSVLAARWREGAYDAALVPVGEALVVAEARLVRGMAIAAEGACESVKLFHRVPLDRVRSVALDRESVTSNMLLRVLAAERLGIAPEWRVPSPTDPFPPAADAFLSIGDKTFHVDPRAFEGVDLGQAWTEWTGLPFVFAAWAVMGAPPAGLAQRLAAARRAGVAALGAIARRESAKLGIEAPFAEHYLRDCLRFDLGAREEEGIARFCDLARRHGLLPPSAAPRFHGEAPVRASTRCSGAPSTPGGRRPARRQPDGWRSTAP